MKKICPDCHVRSGQLHLDGCDVERCLRCGGQRLSCDCKKSQLAKTPRQVWSGEWPFLDECRRLNLWCKWGSTGWVKCDKDDPEAGEDLNSLYSDFSWDRKTQTWKPKRRKG